MTRPARAPWAAAALAAAVLPALFPALAAAQTLGGKGRGLDALDESAVMGRLATDGLDGLLDRDFDTFKVPAADRDQQRAFIQLNQLTNANGLKPADRRALAERVAVGVDGLIPKATDATKLQQQAYQLTVAGITPTVTELEFFGDNPAAQKQLEPVARTVKRMFAKVNELASAQAKALVARIAPNGNNLAPIQAQLRLLAPVRLNAAFSEQMTNYPLCISLPKGDPQRATVADATIDYLKQYDNAQSNIQAGARVQTGKLQLAKGDYAGARATFDTVINGAGQLKPAPTAPEQNDARYFQAVADLLAGHLPEVDADLKALAQWQAVNFLPSLSPGEQDQVKAGSAMLRFRLQSAQADAAANPADKDKFDAAAVTTLADLLQQQQGDPALRDLVFDQIVTRIPDHPNLATLDPLALAALQQQGFDEYDKKDGEPFDRPKLARAVDAARELARRDGQPGVRHATAVNAAEFAAYALDQKLHDDKAAAAAYIDFMERYPTDPDAQKAMQNAGVLVFKLHRAAMAKNEPDPDEAKLYDRFLPLAVAPPYNQKQVAIDYADLLGSQGKYLEAVKYYDLVPRSDKRFGRAEFSKMLALYSALGSTAEPVPADQRRAVAEQLQAVATDVDKAAAAAAATSDAAKQPSLGRIAIARFDAAVSARRDLNDPAKSLEWLDGFEQRTAGLTNEKAFAQTVMVQRVNAYMAQGKTSDATDVLVKLLAADPDAGQTQMFDLIHQIDHDLDVAKGAKDLPAQRSLAANKATLSGFLVKYAQDSKDPKTQAQLPAYRLYDADSKRQAAELSDVPAAKQANLTAALAQYQALTKGDATDPAVLLGVGLTQYDLGHYKEAKDNLAPLLSKHLIGQPTMVVNGQTVENPQFWEATYKQLRSIYEVAKANPGDATAQADLAKAKPYLNGQFVIYGKNTGGAGYHDDFAKLRDEMK